MASFMDPAARRGGISGQCPYVLHNFFPEVPTKWGEIGPGHISSRKNTHTHLSPNKSQECTASARKRGQTIEEVEPVYYNQVVIYHKI